MLPEAGLAAAEAPSPPPNNFPEEAAVLMAPKGETEEGVAAVDEADALLAAPKALPEDGVVDAAPKRFPPGVGVEAVFAEESPPPNKEPAGFWPKTELPVFDGVVLPELPPTLPNEKVGVPAEAPPKILPDAGAVAVVASSEGAVDELGFPKVNCDMVSIGVSC